MSGPSKSHLDDVRSYYRTVGRFLELEQANRNDGVFWETVVDEENSPAILELGTGNGRATIHLAPGAGRLVGLDAVESSLKEGRRRLREHTHVHFVLADIRAIPLSSRFDLVVAANDPFVHMSRDADRDLALKLVAEHLRPGGRFILDAHWLPLSARREAETPDGRIRERPLGKSDDGLTVRETWRCDRDTLHCFARYEYLANGERIGTAAFQGRLWSPGEIDERFQRAGLNVRSVWGSYDRDPWDARDSRRFVVQAVALGG